MLLMKAVQKAPLSSTRVGSSFSAFYSVVSGLTALRNWGVSGTSPISLVGDAPVPVRKTQQQQRPKKLVSSNNGKKPPTLPSTPAQQRLHREKLKQQFPEGWSPPKKLSRQAMDGLRVMHAQHPEIFTTPVLAEKFKVSPEAIRRILKSKWEPTKSERARMLQKEEQRRQEFIRQRRLDEMQSQYELEKERKRLQRQRESSQLSLR